jgi:twinkle protein
MNQDRIKTLRDKLNQVQIPAADFDAYYKQLPEEDSQKVKRVVDYYDDIESFLDRGELHVGAKTPFHRLDDKFRFRPAEVTLWSGQNGHKKSMITGFFCINFLKQKERVCIASLEMKPVRTIHRMVKQYTMTENPSFNEFSDFMDFAAHDLYIFDQMGNISPSRLYGVISYCAKELNVKHFVIDSLMRVVPGEDSYNEQKDFVVRLCELATIFGIHIHLIHHAKKPSGNKTVGGRYDAKGSGAISDNVSNSLIVWSNEEKSDEHPDFVIKCDKQRAGAWQGMIGLKFDEKTLTFEQVTKDDF